MSGREDVLRGVEVHADGRVVHANRTVGGLVDKVDPLAREVRELRAFVATIASAPTSEEADPEATEATFGVTADEVAEMERDNWIFAARALLPEPPEDPE